MLDASGPTSPITAVMNLKSGRLYTMNDITMYDRH